MAALRLLGLGLALVAAVPVQAGSVERWRAHIDEASARFGVPASWIERVMQAESGGRTTLGGRPIVSHAGAMGLMQLMPGTWLAMRARLGLGSDPHAPRDNILAGTLYLRLMYDRFGYPGLFAAYNAGPGRYAAFLAGKRGLPGETRAYVAAVAGLPVTDRALPVRRIDTDRVGDVDAPGEADRGEPPPAGGAIFFAIGGQLGGQPRRAGAAPSLFAVSTASGLAAPDRP